MRDGSKVKEEALKLSDLRHTQVNQQNTELLEMVFHAWFIISRDFSRLRRFVFIWVGEVVVLPHQSHVK